MSQAPTVFRVAIIGTGRVGYQFSFGDLPDNHAEAVALDTRCELVAGVNRGRDKLDAFGQRFGVAALFSDYREMLAEVQPDLVIVATHPELHCEMVETCAQAAATRAIICEKPMALSLSECDRMIAACSAGDVLLQINHNRRWLAEWNLALALLQEGAIGDLNSIFCFMEGCKPTPSWRSDEEGPLLHDFTHYFDLMDLFGGEVAWLCGMAEQRRRPWAVEDFTAAFVKFRNGVTGMIHGSELTEYSDSAFELRGTTGVIRMIDERVELMQSHRDMYEPDSGFQWSALRPAQIDHPVGVSSYCEALDELLAALAGSGTLRSDGVVGRRSLEMVMAVYESQLAGSSRIHFPVTEGGSGVERLRQAGHFSPT